MGAADMDAGRPPPECDPDDPFDAFDAFETGNEDEDPFGFVGFDGDELPLEPQGKRSRINGDGKEDGDGCGGVGQPSGASSSTDIIAPAIIMPAATCETVDANESLEPGGKRQKLNSTIQRDASQTLSGGLLLAWQAGRKRKLQPQVDLPVQESALARIARLAASETNVLPESGCLR
jgi:hypothetical protein